MVELTLDKIKWGGEYHYYFWDQAFNPLANIEYCLPDCTTFVIGDCGVTGTPRPVSRVTGASHWHEYLTNDWTYIPFDAAKLKVGDIIEWTDVPHVARVFKIENGTPWIRGSFYTGENGVSMKDGAYDTRSRFTSLKEVSDFFVENYPNRMYHEYPLEKMNKKVGAQPAYILSMPNFIASVERNESVNQIRTLDDTLRIRTSPSLNGSIVGHVMVGYYNVLSKENATEADRKYYLETKGEELTCWYEIAKDRWCGNVTTEYLPKKSDTDISKAIEVILKACKDLEEENKRYKDGISQIADIANKLL